MKITEQLTYNVLCPVCGAHVYPVTVLVTLKGDAPKLKAKAKLLRNESLELHVDSHKRAA